MPTMRLRPASTADYRRLAEQRLPRLLFDYIDGGSYAEKTLAANVADFEALPLKQRVMRDVSKRDPRITLFGEDWSMPLGLAPVGLAGMMARRAETQAVRAAEEAGIPYCLSTVGICSIEEVAKAATNPFWFQLYMLKDRGIGRDLIARAKAAGCRTLVFTVDLPVMGARYRDMRNGMSGGIGALGKVRSALDYAVHVPWAYDVGVRGRPHVFGNLAPYVTDATTPTDFSGWVAAQFDAAVTWKDIEELRRQWSGTFIVKGVLTPEDARAAADSGADGIVVSNHGGRQLDGVTSSISVLPRVADALGGRTSILLDGGVRSGADVLRAVALGAAAVLIGRPWIWALAGGGRRGLAALLKTFKAELDVAMALTGATTAGAATRDVLDLASPPERALPARKFVPVMDRIG